MTDDLDKPKQTLFVKPEKPLPPNQWIDSSILDDFGYGYTKKDFGVMPDWPEVMRGVPNSILRSALFGATRRGQRIYNNLVFKASVGEVLILHTGPQLDQGDLDVWEQCLHLAKGRPLGVPIEFSARSFLLSIGRDTGKSQYVWLNNSLRRLVQALVEVKDSWRHYMGHLIHDLCRNEESGKYSICINPRITMLYSRNSWSWVDWNHRKALQKSPLAQWLHGFYTSHALAYPYKVETIHRLCGSEAKNVSDFRKDLRKALILLTEVTGWEADFNSNGLLQVRREGSKSQQRHLEKKRKLGDYTTA